MNAEEKLLDLVRKRNGVQADAIVARRRWKAVSRVIFSEKVLSSFVVFALLCAAVTVVFPNLLFSHQPVLKLASSQLPWEKVSIEPAINLPSYLRGIKERDFFSVGTQPAGAGQDTAMLAFENIALIGIVLEDPIQAVLKDKKTGNVYYLKKGENIGDMKIADIMEGKIIVEYNAERYEIYL